MTMKPTAQPSTSWDSHGRTLRLQLPTAWAQLSEPQLRQALALMATARHTPRELQTRLALLWTGLTVVRPVPMHQLAGAWAAGGDVPYLCQAPRPHARPRRFYLTATQLAAMADTLGFLSDTTDCAPRLAATSDGGQPLPLALHGLTLQQYILADRAFHLAATEPLGPQGSRLAAALYPLPPEAKPRGRTFLPEELLSAHLWFAYAKRGFAHQWPHLFKPAPPTDSPDPSEKSETPTPPFSPADHQRQADTLIRALTGGDITKEPAVLAADVWRAFTELEAKAVEAARLKAKA